MRRRAITENNTSLDNFNPRILSAFNINVKQPFILEKVLTRLWKTDVEKHRVHFLMCLHEGEGRALEIDYFAEEWNVWEQSWYVVHSKSLETKEMDVARQWTLKENTKKPLGRN